jgi:hypothetical protein
MLLLRPRELERALPPSRIGVELRPSTESTHTGAVVGSACPGRSVRRRYGPAVDPRPQRYFADLPPAQLHDVRRNDAVCRADDGGDEVAGRRARGLQAAGDIEVPGRIAASRW